MNLLHMKYAVAIAETKSINKAADKLYVGQSNLSRAIKELENNLGITLFERSAKGMFLTPDGELFVRHAKTVLKQVDTIEKMFHNRTTEKQVFSLSAPRSVYIADAFARFTLELEENTEAELTYRETNAMRTIKNLLEEEYSLGIIRYAEEYDAYYKNMLDSKEIQYEPVSSFSPQLTVSENSPLATAETISPEKLKKYIEVVYADPYVPALPIAEVKKSELPITAERRIGVFDRASRLELLSRNGSCYSFMEPLPPALLDRHRLVQLKSVERNRVYKDMILRRKNHNFTSFEKRFIELLIQSKRDAIG